MFGLKRRRAETETSEFIGFLTELRDDYRYTPDILNLESRQEHLVFLYDEFTTGRRQHKDFMSEGDCIRRATAFTHNSNLVMYKKDLGLDSHPVAVYTKPVKRGEFLVKQGRPARIKGELYKLTSTRPIVELDRVRENGVAFKRVRQKVLIPLTRTFTDENGFVVSKQFLKTAWPWMYVGIKSYWDGILDDGYSSKVVSLFEHVKYRQAYAEYPMGHYYAYTGLEEIV